MKTFRLCVDSEKMDSEESISSMERAASILRDGGLVAFPTETVYGLGANALREQAVEGIFRAKQRPSWDPLIVHISGPEMLPIVVQAERLTDSAHALMQAFWPGPLTLLLPKTDAVPAIVTADRPLVGLRSPAHPVAKALIAAAGLPIAAPSANSFGRISPTLAEHVLEDLDGRIDAVLDGGATAHGVESTVVDASRDPVIVYRPGVISLQALQNVCSSATEWRNDHAAAATPTAAASLPAPGFGIRHYAPRSRLILTDESGEGQLRSFELALRTEIGGGRRIGVMLPDNFSLDVAADDKWLRSGHAPIVFPWGDWNDPASLARALFAGLRALDAQRVDCILCPLPPEEGIGMAVRDRLQKAARIS